MTATFPSPACLRPRCAAPLVLLAAMLLAASAGLAHDAENPGPVTLSSKVLQFHPDDPDRLRVGRLEWRGGVEITSRDRRVGGFSGLLVTDDGARLLAVSDKGRWLSAALRYDGESHLAGLDDGWIGPLRDPDGKILSGRRLRDAESLARLGEGGYLVSFEHQHRIWRYDAENGSMDARPVPWPSPAGLDEAPHNAGLEALVALADGGLLALTEGQQDGDGNLGYLWRNQGWSSLAYLPATGFKPTGATRLPGGDILVLERWAHVLGGFRARLVRVAAADIRPGAKLRGEEVARWGVPLTVDNFEAVAARRGPDGEILIYLLSDDNFSLLQRTLLLMFALVEE